MTQLPRNLCNCSCSVSATPLEPEGHSQTLACVEEQAVAFRYNGFAHGVMMATPSDLEDFATGFSLTEAVIDSMSDIEAISIEAGADGIAVDISLSGASLHRYLAGRRIRQLRGHSGCGLCGVQDLADVQRPIPQARAAALLRQSAIVAAFEGLRDWQPLSRSTRGAHAAAWVTSAGLIQTVREDVGRHNALDKLIGAGLRGSFVNADGFCLVTSRCSFEMVQKAVAAGFSAIVSASAPTALAIRAAKAAGLALCALSREREPLIFTQSNAFEETSWRPNAS
jgi:FdhD protein